MKELECYDALLASNIQPEVYYFYRSQVKLRMLEVAPCLKSVEQAIADSSSSRQDFIEGIFNDLDEAQHYSKQKFLFCNTPVKKQLPQFMINSRQIDAYKNVMIFVSNYGIRRKNEAAGGQNEFLSYAGNGHKGTGSFATRG